MRRLFLLLTVLILASLMSGCAASANAEAAEPGTSTGLPETSKFETLSEAAKADCPVTVPQEPHFTAPLPYSPDSPFASNFWYGSNSLWTDLPKDGVWYALPHNPKGYTQKIFWWREGYIWNEEPEPELTVTGERLDAPAPPLIASKATNAHASDIGSAMLVGVDFPTLGCWKITGSYGDAELSFVVWVGP
ncbi:MAG: hypothetical protein M3Y68_16830 [Chloroflexota bacterium]|nr:hypothetical protein [Chloroflexota bacterium]